MFVKVLFEGEHTNHDLQNDTYMIYPHTSSVTLLKNDEYAVLFDTGSFAYTSKLLQELKQLKIMPEDITHICLSHFHTDHTSNCNLFPKAEIHASRSVVNHTSGRSYVYKDIAQKKLPLGIEVFETPGHTNDHVVYFFEVEGKKYCCAGDAVREDIIMNGPPKHYSAERGKQFLLSAKQVFDKADIIVPGHFRVIKDEYKQSLYQKLLQHLS